MKYKIILLLMVLFSWTMNAQDSVRRPKIGLVLSGGGAKGFAHIGVLKVLEENGIKVDYIGGTSMGAIIGGLYASGYNATQIDSIFRSTDFDALLQDYLPRAAKNFYGKRSDELYALTLPFDNFKIGIPRAYSKGLYNFNLMSRLLHRVRHVDDFNKLPIPFFCIATDIETGEEVLLNKGYLPMAIRASSALPSLFSPVELDGKLLVDGGVANNYPIEEVRKMGADIIIGVDVQDGLKDRKALNDATRILGQISTIGQKEIMKRKRAETDIYIKPELNEFSVLSFSEGGDIIAKGEAAAKAQLERIKSIVHPTGYKRPDLGRENDSLCIHSVSINKLDNYTRAYVLGKLGFKNQSMISYDDLKRGIDNLSATQNFSSISYSIHETDGEEEFRLNLVENPSRTMLRFGLHYDGLYKSGVLTNFTHKRLLFKNDVISLDVGLGDNTRYNLDYYVDNGFYFSFGLRSRYNQFNSNINTDFSNGDILQVLGLNTINIDFFDLSNQVYVQTLFMQKFILGIGAEMKYLQVRSETLPTADKTFEKSRYFSTLAYLKYDSYDNKYFPKIGWLASADFQSYLSSTNYNHDFSPYSILKAEAGIARTLYRKFTVKGSAEAGGTIGDGGVPYFNFILGGFGFQPVDNIKPFYGYDFLGISGDSYLKVEGTLDYEIFRKNHLNFTANFAQVGNGLFRDADWISSPKYTGYAFGYGMETIIGPIEIKYSWSPELPKGFVWFNVGFAF
ncbi:patatin-like phospholipase family protein [Flavobacterium silvaticum]|uniref:Patatin n=1 Tax=Flavobacterium silvaticum TaxID=1852020 RepID=A0A972FLV4_9FLAO|nr:patatin-like phospholipase family protein [Flavobacterium silvaticum]NMH27610.1 patatin [Flavobacterium silvaticum]